MRTRSLRLVTVSTVVLAFTLSGCSESAATDVNILRTSSPVDVRDTNSATTAATTEPVALGAVAWSEAAVKGDLAQMVLTITDDQLVMIQAQGPTPSAGTVLYSATLGGLYQIGLKSMDGEVIVFAYDFDSGKQANLDSAYVYGDGQVSFRVPASNLPKLATPFSWKGAVTVDGADTGTATGPEIAGPDE